MSQQSTMSPLRLSPSGSSGSEFKLGRITLGDDGSIYERTAPPDPDAGLSQQEKDELDRKLVRKLDWILLPWLCFLYLVSFLDRTNIGNAKIAHLTDDVPMTTQQYNLTLTIFFISYALFEALANILLKRFRPSIFLPVTMALWGIVMVGMGFVTNWDGLMAARWFLGVMEAGLFPGVNYYLSCWYKRNEFAVRAAIFFSAAALSGSFGGLLAAAIQNLDAAGGRPGWAWIFIIEGVLTVLVGLVSFWMVQDFPAEATFLSPDERVRVLRRLHYDQQASARDEAFQWKYFWQAVTDWKTYMGMFLYMGPIMPLYSFSLFLPSIIANMGFTADASIVQNQLLSVPPYAGAAVLTVLAGWLSDRQQQRGLYNLCLAPVALAGFAMLLATTRPAVQYAGTFLAALGLYPTVPITIAWVANNVEGVYKRGIVLGMVIGWGNLNGVVSSNIFFGAPRFAEGHAAVIAYLAVCVFGGALAMRLLLRRENRLRRAGGRDDTVAHLSQREVDELGDLRPDFLYTL